MKSALLYGIAAFFSVLIITAGGSPGSVATEPPKRQSTFEDEVLRLTEEDSERERPVIRSVPLDGSRPLENLPPEVQKAMASHSHAVQQDSEPKSDVEYIEDSAEKLRKDSKALVKLLRKRRDNAYGYTEQQDTRVAY